MTITTEINQEKKIRKHTFSGKFDFGLLYKMLDDVYKNPADVVDMNVLWDLAEMDDINYLTAQQLYDMVALVSWRWNSKGKRKAALIISRPGESGLTDLDKNQRDNNSRNEIRFFHDTHEAIQWLE
jgi:hypothetical protein